MKQDIILLLINAGLYIALSIYYIRKLGFGFRTFPLILWAGSSVACIVYYTHPYRTHEFHDSITLVPFLYLFVLVWLSFIPLLRFDRRKIKNITISQNVFTYVSIAIIIFSLLTIYPNVSYYLTHMTSAEAYLEQYEDKLNGESIVIMSDTLGRFMRFCKYFRGITILFFVLSFTCYVKKNLYIQIGLFIAWINTVINFMNTSSRYALYTDLLYLFFLYLLFSGSFTSKVKKRVKIIGSSMAVGLIAITIIITLARFGENSGYTKTLDYTLSLYAGEAFVNFNGDMWNMPETANGENCFGAFIYKLQGKDDINRDYLHLEHLVNRRMNVFYSFIGDYYTDFGRLGTIVFVIFLNVLFVALTKPRKTISIATLILLALYAKILLVGFTYWTYLNFTYEILGSIFVAILFSCSKSKKYDFNSNGNI